ncbi:ankyrin repeat domain-containing protein [uncultured Piscinibacter sp.]|uniref:ankyrin repeat domain-containing protein n=1 Tax=uncultured Piscinibacter sp. TaxID=1131835 RepID=UPI00260DC9F8|nr:ankyrin repeat domain-containing protein [uncultured Piscinibacter sp.]
MTDSLFDAIRAGDLDAVERLASAERLNVAGAGGTTPLMLAAVLGQRDVVARLIDKGADVNAADERGFTALFHACYNPDEDRGHPEVVELLLAAGADKEAKIGYGVRPLMYAAGNGEAGVVSALLRGGADPLARNEVGRTALMMVKDRDYVDVINILHEAEATLESASCASRNAPDMQVVTFLKPARKD